MDFALTPVVYNAEKVLTSQQLAQAYSVDPKILNNNYLRNIDRYIDGVHYYKLSGETLKTFKEGVPQVEEQLKFTSSLFLWTEKGCLLHSKSLNSDKSWEVYERLIDTYFRVKNIQLQLSNLSPQLQVLINIEMQQKAMQEKLDTIEGKVDNIKNIITLTPSSQWRLITNAIIVSIGKKIGDYKKIRDEIYAELDKRANSKIKVRLTNKRTRMIAAGMTQTQANDINYLDVISEDQALLSIYIQVVKEFAIKNDISLVDANI